VTQVQYLITYKSKGTFTGLSHSCM